MKTLPNTSKEQRVAVINFLGQHIANSFNVEVMEHKKAYLLFTYNQRQVAINVVVHDPPYTVTKDQPVFYPKVSVEQTSKFDINVRNKQSQEKEQELKELAKELDDLRESLAAQNMELTLREEELCNKEAQLQNREIELSNKETSLSNKETEINKRQSALNQRDIELVQKEGGLKRKEAQLVTQEMELEQHKNEVVVIEDYPLQNRDTRLADREDELSDKEVKLNTLKKQLRDKEDRLGEKEINLKVKETQLNNHINDALLRQNELDAKEKDLVTIKGVLDSKRQNLDERERQISVKEQQLSTLDLDDKRTMLDSPTLEIELLNRIPFLKWFMIQNADNYSINYSFNSEPVDTDDMNFDVHVNDNIVRVNLANFIDTGEYEFTITATADDENPDYKNSLPSTPITHFVFNQQEEID